MQRLPAPDLPDFIARQLPDGVTRYAVDVDGAKMHVMERGRGQTVLMVHGNPTWGFLYRKVAAALDPERFRVVLPDLIGFGFSDKLQDEAKHTLRQHRMWMQRLVEAAELEDVIVVGQDWGGPVGFGSVAEDPSRVAGLVVLNTVIGPPKPGFKPTAFHRLAHTRGLSDVIFRGLGFPQINLNVAQGDKRSIRGDTARAYRYPLRGLRNNLAPLATARMVPNSPGHPSIAELERCFAFVSGWKGPAAIVWGDRDPVLGSVRTHVERTLPQAKVTRTQAGHFLQEEVPEEIAAAVRLVAVGG